MSSYKLTNEQSAELVKCAKDFVYFCEHYVTIKTWKDNNYQQVPFKLYPFQEELAEHWMDNRFSIGSKFRQGGFTTLAVIYGLWNCLFKVDQRIMYLAKTDRDAIDDGGRVAETALAHMPEWMKGLSMKNDHTKKFDTGSVLRFHTPQACCGMGVDLLIIDEASFIKDIELHWKAMWPVLSTGGRCIVQSSVNTDEDWFWERIIDARAGVGMFKEFKCHYTDRPEFAQMAWETQMKSQLGLQGWDVDVLQNPIRHKPVVVTKPKTKRWRNIFDEWGQSAD